MRTGKLGNFSAMSKGPGVCEMRQGYLCHVRYKDKHVLFCFVVGPQDNIDLEKMKSLRREFHSKYKTSGLDGYSLYL